MSFKWCPMDNWKVLCKKSWCLLKRFRTLKAFKALFEADTEPFWLKEVRFEIKKVHWRLIGRLNTKDQGPKSRDKKKLSVFFKPFQVRRTDKRDVLWLKR